MTNTDDTKDLIFIAKWAIPAGFFAGLLIHVLTKL
jgi:hypothetical protein